MSTRTTRSAQTTHASRVYVAYRGGLYVVDGSDSGVEPSETSEPSKSAPTATVALEGCDVECLAATGTTVLAGTFDAGLFRSTDAGDTFERVGEGESSERADEGGIGPDAVTAVTVSPHDPDVVWVGTEPSRIFRSTDGGDSFERLSGVTEVPSASEWSFPPRPETHHVRWIEPAPDDPERWYVGIEAGALLVTEDGGETWIDRPSGSRRDNHTLATHPRAPGRVYAAAGDGYAESADRGISWRTNHEELDHRYVWGLAVDPGDPDTVLVSAASGANAAHRRGEAFLYRKQPSGDAGGRGGTEDPANATWERLDGRGVPTGSGTHRAVLAGGRDAGEVWLCHDGGLYVTADGGDSFEPVPVDLPTKVPRALAVV